MSIWWPGPWGAGIMSGGTRTASESPHQQAIATPEEEKEPVCPMPTPKKARTRKTAPID